MISPGADGKNFCLLDPDLTAPRDSQGLSFKGRSCFTQDLAANTNSSCCLCPACPSYHSYGWTAAWGRDTSLTHSQIVAGFK